MERMLDIDYGYYAAAGSALASAALGALINTICFYQGIKHGFDSVPKDNIAVGVFTSGVGSLALRHLSRKAQ